MLAGDVERLLAYLGRLGYAGAEIVIRKVTLADVAGEAVLYLDLAVETGERLSLRGILLPGSERTSPAFAMRLAQLHPGRWIEADLTVLRRELEATGFYRRVDAPYLVRVGDGQADLYIPVVEEPPGAFDLVLGYQPPVEGSRGGVVGSGHLVLKNLFGHGRIIAMKLNRLPGQISRFNARYADPFVAGLPFGIDLTFEGIQQDSTYGRQVLGGGIVYRISGGTSATATVSRELTRPGQAGVRIVPGTRRQAVPRADGWFYGLRLDYSTTDTPVNPRRGLTVTTAFDRGRKDRLSLLLTEDQDTTTERSAIRQERLEFAVRTFVPVFNRQVAVFGGDARVLRSTSYDLSDLLRFGGATSLRGYDEERFLGRFVGRLLAEYRYQVDRFSYVYLFFDLGYVETPAAADLTAGRDFYPGYGLGMQFSTGLGLVNMSYALGRGSRPVDGKVHLGLSVGL
jgi:outer membrane protein assembly factor BamA